MIRSEHKINHYYMSLKRNMVLMVILVSFTPMAISNIVILERFNSSYRDKVHAHLAELISNHRQSIDSFLSERLNNIHYLARSFPFDSFQNEAFVQAQLAHLQKEYGAVFEDMGVVDENGIQIAYAGPFHLIEAHYSDADWFRKAIGKEYFISDVFSGLRGKPHFIVSVRTKTNDKYWILRATIDFLAFNSLVENLHMGTTGFAYIINTIGEFQTKPRFELLWDQSMYADFLGHNPVAGNQVRIFEKKDQKGIRKIFAAAFLKNQEWLMIFQQDTSDAFAELSQSQHAALVISIIGGLFIIGMAVFLSRRMTRKVEKSDFEKEMMNQKVIETGKLASLGELSAGIAHEINNPVAIMVEEAGWMEDLLAEENLQSSENFVEFQKSLTQIKTQGRRCKEITHKLLSFARKTDTNLEAIQINELIEEVVSLSGQRAKYANIKIETEVMPGLPLVKVSESEMQQVFFNIINNAIDAMETKGGTIQIKTRYEDDHLILSFSDNGPGIPESYLSRIFDPFFTTKPVGKGTGLGLSICYGIIKKMGGEIDVKSVVDYGTVFNIRIPLTA